LPQLRLTRAARADLREIYAYTYVEWGKQQADSYLDGLEQAMDRVAKGSATIRPLQSKHPNTLKLKQGRHLIVLRETGYEQILVVRVLHERMDIDAHLGG
jgi:toxin ParE1/3/4